MNFKTDYKKTKIEQYNKYATYIFTILIILIGFLSIFYYHDTYKTIVSFGSIIVLYIPNILERYNIKLKRLVKFYWINILFWGVIGETITPNIFWYDKIIHLFSGFWIIIFSMILLLHRFGELKILKRFNRSLIYSFFFTMIILLLWELFEATMDFFFKTNLLQGGIIDTLGDILSDILGTITGALFCFWHWKKKKIHWFKEELLEFQIK